MAIIGIEVERHDRHEIGAEHLVPAAVRHSPEKHEDHAKEHVMFPRQRSVLR